MQKMTNVNERIKRSEGFKGFINGKEDEERSALYFGKNTITKKRRKSFISIFIKNLGDPVIKILLFALALNLVFMFRGKDWHEGVGIALSVVLATVISSVSEYKRDRAFEKLDVSSEGTCRVMRNGNYLSLPYSELLVGDVAELSAGDKIPADCILIEGAIKADQSPLTGESEEIEKLASPEESRKIHSLMRDFFCREADGEMLKGASQQLTPSDGCALFNGCFIREGFGKCVVTAVGNSTRLGMISDSLSGKDEESPLKERLGRLASQISRIGYVCSVLIALAYLFNIFIIESNFTGAVIMSKLSDVGFVLSSLIDAFTVALTVIVMAVPEGLPMMIAVVLSRNAGRMASDNVLVRQAQGIEAAGCMNILFTDKTGTLTVGRPSVCGIITSFGEYASRRAYSQACPSGEELLAIIAEKNTEATFDGRGGILSGNTTERALLAFTSRSGRARFGSLDRLYYEPFSSKKKSSSAVVTYKGRKLLLLKGAPDILIKRCELMLNEKGEAVRIDRTYFERKISEHSSRGERLLLCALSEGDSSLCVLCVVAMRDKLRSNAEWAVSSLKRAGIHTVMITGDGKETAEKIASDCRILTKATPLSLSGEDIDRLSESELCECLPRLSVVYRALPEHKATLVRMAKRMNLTCGMTGDGLNDAPALKSADCGFALGSGSEVCKDAADIIILDDNLESVVNAVLHGRNIFLCIRKFITLQLIMNFTAMAVSMIGPFIGIEVPVTVVQMLWINIVMDTLGGLAFSGERADRRLLREKPILRDEPVLNRKTVSKVARLSLFTCALCVFFLKSRQIHALLGCDEGSTYHLTAFFALLIFSGALNCFNARTDRLNLFSGISKNPTFILIIGLVAGVQTLFIYFGSSVMRTVPLSFSALILTVSMALPVVVFEFFSKVYLKLCK